MEWRCAVSANLSPLPVENSANDFAIFLRPPACCLTRLNFDIMAELRKASNSLHLIRYDTIGEFNVDWKAECEFSTRSQKHKIKKTKTKNKNKKRKQHSKRGRLSYGGESNLPRFVKWGRVEEWSFQFHFQFDTWYSDCKLLLLLCLVCK